MAIHGARGGGCCGARVRAGASGVAHAGDPTSFKIAKHPDGPYSHTDVSLHIAQGQKKQAYLKIRGDQGGDETVELSQQSNDLPPGYNTKYFKDNGTNITGAVKGSGFEFEAKLDKSKRFRVQVKREPGTTGNGCAVTRLDEQELVQFRVIKVNTGACT